MDHYHVTAGRRLPHPLRLARVTAHPSILPCLRPHRASVDSASPTPPIARSSPVAEMVPPLTHCPSYHATGRAIGGSVQPPVVVFLARFGSPATARPSILPRLRPHRASVHSAPPARPPTARLPWRRWRHPPPPLLYSHRDESPNSPPN
jgi:hypothetical protein